MILRILAVLICATAVVSAEDVIHPHERIIRRLTRDDVPQVIRNQSAALFSYESLFDGGYTGSFTITAQADGEGTPRRLQLMSIDPPSAVGDRYVLVGRVCGYTATSQGQMFELPPRTDVDLEWSADVDGGPPLRSTLHVVNIHRGGSAFEPFRLELPKPAGGSVKTLNLNLTVSAGITIAFDELAILGPGEPATSRLPSASQLPPGLQPVVVQSTLPFNDLLLDDLKLDQVHTPVLIQADQGSALPYAATFNRPSLDGSARRVPLVSLDLPGIEPGPYGVTGSIRYNGLEPGSDLTGPAWFELRTEYADGSKQVTATTADFGPAGIMRGRSGDRPFAVVTTSAVQPVRFRLELVCCGAGRVEYSQLSLVRYGLPSAPAVAAVPPPWWTLPRYTRPAAFAVLGLMLLVAVLFLMPSVASQSWGLLFILALIAQAAFGWGMSLVGRGVPPAGVAGLLIAPAAWLVPLAARSLRVGRVRRQELRRMLVADAAV